MLRVRWHLVSLSTGCYLLDNFAQNIHLMFSVPTLIEFAQASLQHEILLLTTFWQFQSSFTLSPFAFILKTSFEKFWFFHGGSYATWDP